MLTCKDLYWYYCKPYRTIFTMRHLDYDMWTIAQHMILDGLY